MSRYVLDSSALLALINQEKGMENVLKVLPGSIMSAVNLSEVGSVLKDLNLSLEKIHQLISPLVREIYPFDEEQAYIASELRAKTKEKGLSLGDRACLSLAQSKHLKVLTADRIWKTLDINIEIELIR